MRQTIDLNGAWQFGSVPRRPFDTLDVDDRAGVAEWLPASVPGNVRADLLALGRIPAPFYGTDYRASLWVEACDWWYRRPLSLALGPGQRAFLIFDGIDYLSAIFVNGRELARHAGMFSRQLIEVTGLLAAGSAELPVLGPQAQVAVRIWGSGALPRRHLTLSERLWARLADRLDPTGTFPDRTATLKCQMSFGWDFAPPIRTMGIWDDVRLVVTEGVFIEDIYLTPSPSPERRGEHISPATLAVQVTLDSDRPRPICVEVTVRPANFAGASYSPAPFDLALPAGRSLHTLAFDLPDPQLWQPWDRGFPHLYELGVAVIGDQPSNVKRQPSSIKSPISDLQPPISNLQSPTSPPLDSLTTRFGIRHITVDDWIFAVNGRREFIRGVNWVPADSLPGRLRREDYTRLLGMARAAGANLLRVWGGGLREKRAFYDLCDELGLLVWQEFPFACAFLGYFPRDDAWLALAERECAAIVQAVRCHPSLALWCGGNEFSPRRNRRLVNTLEQVVAAQDGTRPFVPASPSPGDVHNWNVWHGYYPPVAYREEAAHFLSEFGLQAPPALETLRACLPEADLWPPGAGWEAHKAELSKLRWYAIAPPQSPAYLLREVLSDGGEVAFPPPSDGGGAGGESLPSPFGRGGGGEGLPSFIAASQRAQALGLQIAVEHMRRHKGQAGGLCVWQFNEPWPAISWAIVDYYRRPKLAYERLKDLYNLVLVGLHFPLVRYHAGDVLRAEVWAVNDSLHALDGCRLTIELDGVRIFEMPVALPPDSAQTIGALHHPILAEPGRLTLLLRQGDRPVARNAYDLTYDRPAPAGWPRRLVRWAADALLR
jgi:beta-mannosidase